MNKDKITLVAFMVIISTFFSKILGFLREMLIGNVYGASKITDAYYISTTIPNVLFLSLITAIVTTYIPIYSKIKNEEGYRAGITFTNNLLNIVCTICIIISAFCIFFAKPIVSFIAVGFDKDTLDLAIHFSMILFPMIIFIGATKIFSGYLQSNNSYIIPVLINVPNNIIIILVLIFNKYFSVYTLLYATLLGTALQAFIQYPFIKKKSYNYKFVFKLNDTYIKRITVLALPVLIGTAVQEVNILIDRMLASGLAEGSISALNFADKLNGFIFGIFTLSISTVVFPLFSSISADKDYEKLRQIFIFSINILTIMLIPITAIMMQLNTFIVKILFERGAFNQNDTFLTSSALFYYCIGMIFFGYRDILNKAFYSIHDTKTPMINGIFAVIGNIILNLILVKYMAHSGLALATSLSAMLTSALLFYNLNKKIGGLNNTNILQIFMKCLIAALLMSIEINLLIKIFSHTFILADDIIKSITTIIAVLVGLCSYFMLIYILKVNEVVSLFSLFKEKFVSLK